MNQSPHDLFGLLDRHAQRRQQAVPTITVLCGSVKFAIRLWQTWAASRQHHFVQSSDPATAISDWTASLARCTNLAADARAYLATRTRRPQLAQRATWEAKTAHDVERLWEGLSLDRETDPTVTACDWLIRQEINGFFPTPDHLAERLDQALECFERPRGRLIEALVQLVPAELLPSLLLVPTHLMADKDWLAPSARFLASLVTRLPSLHVAVAVEQEELTRFFQSVQESQVRTLLREGIVPIADAVQEQFSEQSQDSETSEHPLHLVSPDVQLSATVIQAFDEAMQQRARLLQAQSDDEARSAAERFLFELLESIPRTKGRFKLNGSLDFRFGPTNAEIDLLARDWHLTVEIDGFFHFRDPDAYRRDRRKDWELQRRGYLVVRVLADDVLRRTDEVLDRILAAVEHCSTQTPLSRTIQQ